MSQFHNTKIMFVIECMLLNIKTLQPYFLSFEPFPVNHELFIDEHCHLGIHGQQGFAHHIPGDAVEHC